MIARQLSDGAIEKSHRSIDEIPEYDRAQWLPCVGNRPSVDERVFTVSGPDYVVSATQIDEIWRITPRDLATVKSEAKARIDAAAEQARLRYITAGAGQALEYNEAAEEAVRFAATGGAGTYPMLQASVDAGEAPDLATAAALVTGRENAWATIGASIRRLRLTAKRAVDAATTVDEAAAAATVAWP